MGWLRFRRSVFFKLLAILVLTAISVNLLIYVGLRRFGGPAGRGREVINRNVEIYLRSLAEDLGDPPQASRAAALVERTGLAVRVVQGAAEVFASEPGLPDIDGREVDTNGFIRSRGRPGLGERPYAALARGPYTVVFYAPESARMEGSTEMLIAVLVLASAIIGLSYVVISRTLSPVKELAAGVAAIGEGRFDQLVTVRGRDEFAELAAAFNGMMARISQMIAAKEQLLIDVSHELRSPITRMKMTAHLLTSGEAQERLVRNLGEMEGMVTAVLASAQSFAPLAGEAFVATDLAALVHACCALQAGRLPAIEFRSVVTAADGPALVRANPLRASAVVQNLLENALKFSAESGPPVRVTVERQAAGFAVVVSDDGVGIPANELARIMEPFYRVDKSRSKETGGYGLGLSLSQRIMAAHGGALTVTSDGLGRGTTATAVFLAWDGMD